jgi:hypothetical protein
MSISSTYVKCAAVRLDRAIDSAIRRRMPRSGIRSSSPAFAIAIGGLGACGGATAGAAAGPSACAAAPPLDW